MEDIEHIEKEMKLIRADGRRLDGRKPDELRPVRIAVKLSAEDSAKAYGDIKGFGTILKEEWSSTGAWLGVVEMPAGLQTDFLERLNAKTKGNVETRVLKADQRI